MRWPRRGCPELHQRGKWWLVRWYDPITKRARALRTRSETYAKMVYEFMKGTR